MGSFDPIFSAFRGRLARILLSSIVLPASLTPPVGSIPGKPALSILSLPPKAVVASDADFGRGISGSYYFISPSHPRSLFRLLVEHPMGAKDLWRESWSTISLPARPDFRVQAAVVGLGHLFLGGERKGGGAVVRSFQIGVHEHDGQEKMDLTGQVDYFPDTSDVSIRLLFLDQKARILWLGYDSGRVESGLPFLVLHDRILWSDPSSYIPLPSETDLSAGPPPLVAPRATLPSGEPCFSCRFYLTDRLKPQGGEIKNLPVHAPRSVGSSMGILPAGQGMGIFIGHHPHLCTVPLKKSGASIGKCHRLLGRDLPVAAQWWGNRLAYLFPPGTFAKGYENRWVVASINPAFLYSYVQRQLSGKALDLSALLREKGDLVALPAEANPRRRTMTIDGRDLIIFGKSHLYRIIPGS